MKRSLALLRRGLYVSVVVGSLTFGVAQAFGSAAPGPQPFCPATGYPYDYGLCNTNCPEGGHCSATGRCECGPVPYWRAY